ncbi:hypothetical protein Cni_G24085 [Canna indica]|uniref:VQ domain-containing protein n=1 Tax=Canna indica TaxID=4628 RepID=A0AAQ3KV86_9LILI|nr:hypothetical protein Cni_G24085 [Canna indica]
MRPHQKAELQARDPAVNEESHKIHKSKRKPVVIYMVSPQVIHAEASEFMALVQRLTGPGAAAPASASARASTSTGCSHGGGGQGLPVRVKARPLSRLGPRGEQFDASTSRPEAATSGAETLCFHDLSPPSASYVVRKDEPPMASHSHSWLLHGEYLDKSPRHQPGFSRASPPAFLDIFGKEQDH